MTELIPAEPDEEEGLGEAVKEVFALFGVAYLKSEVLHREIAHAYALLSFGDQPYMTRPRLEEKLVLAFSLTLGKLIELSRPLFPVELQDLLAHALQQRNSLAHGYWWERSDRMVSADSLRAMRAELTALSEVFNSADQAVAEYLRPRRQALGITDEWLESEMARLLAGAPYEPFITGRRPKKQERLVRVWDVKVGAGITHIFETEDGALWQLCDAGLGWTCLEVPAKDWEVDEAVQKYLPATVDPRPRCPEPWNYEFRLAAGAVLWVRRCLGERTYRWGVKTPQART